MPSLISLRSITKRYEGSDQAALDAIDLDFETGAITAVMGPSGCGKSTLLNLIGAIDRPTSGQIRVESTQVDRLGERDAARFRRTTIGFVFQFFHLLEDLSVRDNVAIAALLAGQNKAHADDLAGSLLAQLGLSSFAGRLPGALSGGERQRVAIARAVINRPTVLLADEPTGALDRRNGEGVLALLQDLNRRGQTIVVVTHDEQLARGTANRVIQLLDGRVAADSAGAVA
jgi:putative ABC transport system ATP-binding protein